MYDTHTFTYRNYIGSHTKHLKRPTLTKSVAPKDATGAVSTDPVDIALIKMEVKTFVARKSTLDQNTSAMYPMVWGQCSRTLQDKLKGSNNFTAMYKQCDVITLKVSPTKSNHNSILPYPS